MRQTEGRTDSGQTDERTNRQTDGQTDGQMDSTSTGKVTDMTQMQTQTLVDQNGCQDKVHGSGSRHAETKQAIPFKFRNHLRPRRETLNPEALCNTSNRLTKPLSALPSILYIKAAQPSKTLVVHGYSMSVRCTSKHRWGFIAVLYKHIILELRA